MPNFTATVAALILERPLCFHCLGEKSGASRGQVATAVRTIEGALTIQVSQRRCHGCGEIVEDAWLDR